MLMTRESCIKTKTNDIKGGKDKGFYQMIISQPKKKEKIVNDEVYFRHCKKGHYKQNCLTFTSFLKRYHINTTSTFGYHISNNL